MSEKNSLTAGEASEVLKCQLEEMPGGRLAISINTAMQKEEIKSFGSTGEDGRREGNEETDYR
jgi:hypothetical protein